MKQICIAVAILLTGITSFAQEKSARVFGKVNGIDRLNFDGASSVISDLGSVKLETDENGYFEVVVPLEKPAYFTILRNPVYLSPGDELEVVHIDAYPEKSIFKGKGAEATMYLRQRFFSKGGSYLSAGSYAYPEFEKTRLHIDSTVNARSRELEALSGVTEEFRELERIRIKADLLNSLMMYPDYREMQIQRKNPQVVQKSKEEYGEMLNSFYSGVKTEAQGLLDELSSDEKYLELEVVRTALARVGRSPLFKLHSSKRFEELSRVAGMARSVNDKMDETVYQEMLAFGDKIAYADFKEAFLAKINRNISLMEGKPAPDSEMKTVDGALKKLSAFKGKPMYVDVWATWCGPCMAESPFFKALSERYPNIRFIAVSVDDAKAWDRAMKGKDTGNVLELLTTDPDFRKKWDIVGIPRFLLIDENFNIITPNAPRPSQQKEILPLLEKYNNR